MIPRQQQRHGFDENVRLRLLEDDADETDRGLAGLRDELRAIRTVLMGLLISVATGCVLFALNIAFGTLHR